MDSRNGQVGPPEISVLLVEDDRGIAGLYRQRLELEGYAVTVAPNGEAALADASASVPQLVFLDVRLPGLSGLEVLERLRKDRRTRQLPVVVLSNWLDEEERTRALKLGALDYVLKSEVRPGELARRIPLWLAAQESRRRDRPTSETAQAAS